VSIVSGRNAKDGKGTEEQGFKTGDSDKTIEIARLNPHFPCKNEVVVGSGFEPEKA
jgi:hypothetical protein